MARAAAIPRLPGTVGGPLVLEGMGELKRAFRMADNKLHNEMVGRLKHAAEPVALKAESLSISEIRRMKTPSTTVAWWEMRVGVTQKFVYMTSARRGTKNPKRKRPNLKDLLLDRAMYPAVEQHKDDVFAGVEDFLREIGKDWEKV